MAEHDEKGSNPSPLPADASPSHADASPPDDLGPRAKGWIENLAQRSTGLPREESLNRADDRPDKSGWKYAGYGLQFAGTIIVLTFVGYELDKWRGWFPWGTVTLSMVGVIGSMYLLIKEFVMEPQKASRKKKT